MANTPSPQNYTLGKGILYFDKFNPTTQKYEGSRDMGNSPEVSMTIAPEKLPHFNSRGGLKVKDKEIVTEMTMGISFTLDEPNRENLALMFMADQVTVTQLIQADKTKEIGSVALGRFYDLDFKKISNPLGVSSVSVDEKAPGTKEYVEGVDYTIDYTNGRIFILYASTTAVPATIVAGDTIVVTYDADACVYSKLQALNQTEIEGKLRFISDNPVGENHDMQAWRVSLIPSGDLGLIGEDWMTLSFEAEVLKDEVGHPASPFMDIITL